VVAGYRRRIRIYAIFIVDFATETLMVWDEDFGETVEQSQ
jgi:hypothetical protein